MEVRLLGALEVRDDAGMPLPIAGGQQRTLVALLALNVGNVVSTDRLIDEIWSDSAPQEPANALQIVVSKLRRALGAQRIVTRPPGYVLALDGDQIDVVRMERLVKDGRAALARDDADVAVSRLDEALALWRGPPLAEFGDVPTAVAAATRLEEFRAAAAEDRFDAMLALGRHSEVVHELDAAIALAPFRERLRGQMMLALYRSGRQADALRAFRDARRTLTEELGLEPSEDLRRLESAILAHDPALDVPVEVGHSIGSRPAAGTPTNLRPSLNTFVGRHDEMATVGTLLDEHRLVTLAGAGGCGKTRLASEFAIANVALFPDGVWLVALDSLADGRGVMRFVADALGLSAADTVGQPALAATETLDRLRHMLVDRKALIVLDNCEHLIEDAAAATETLLTAAPWLRVLATSREPLRVPGEVVWRVPPLDTDASVELFTQRARGANSTFHLTEQTSDVVADICARLDGMPIAIELIAARTSAFTVTQISDRLNDRFRLLAGGARTALPRQQTLRAVTDWSYELLDSDERTVFERLSAFSGGCTLDAAEAVCADAMLDAADVGPILARLVDKSLVIADGSGRFRMLQTLIQYGAERLDERNDAESVRDRHASYFATMADGSSDVDAVLRGGQPQEWWLSTLSTELDNIRAALTHSIGRCDAVTAQRLAGRLGWFWWFSGRIAEGRHWLDLALGGDGPSTPAARAPAVGWSAWLEVQSGHTDGIAERAAEAAELSEAVGDFATLALAWSVVGVLELISGRNDAAADNYAKAGDAYERLGDVWGLAMAGAARSRAAALRNDTVTERRETLVAIDALRRLGDNCTMVLLLDHLSHSLQREGSLDEARSVAEEGLAISRKVGLRGWQSTMSTQLGSLALDRGDVESAIALHNDALQIAREIALPSAEATALANLAAALERQK